MATARRYRLSPATRKFVLFLHIAAAGGWLGMDLVLGILVVTAFTADPVGAGAAAASIASFTTWPLATVGLLTLATGVVLGVGSKYGLTRYWWVLIKLVLNVVLVTLVIFMLAPTTTHLGSLAQEALADGAVVQVPADLVFPPIVSSTAVLIAIALSVAKPWGRLTKDPGVRSMTGMAPKPKREPETIRR